MSAMVREDGRMFLSRYGKTNDHIMNAIHDRFIQPGDILVLDKPAGSLLVDFYNAGGSDVRDEQPFRVDGMLLPAYSPELNPIEKVFGRVKNFVRHHRSNKEVDLHLLVFVGHSRVSVETIGKFYIHCLTPWHKDKDWVAAHQQE
eukprot:gene4315-5039_t